MKKVVFAIPQLTGGGAERVVSIWANELAKEDYDVSVLAFHSSINEYVIMENVKKLYVASTKEEYLELSYLQRLKVIRKHLIEEEPEYVISFLPPMQIMCMLATPGLGIKRIDTIRNNPWEIKFGNIWEKYLWKMCYYTSHRIILQASEQKNFFSKQNQNKSVLIPNPISPVYRENYKSNKNYSRDFIAVGRIVPQKNYGMMVSAFEKVCQKRENLVLRIFGTGDERCVTSLKQMIDTKGLGDNVKLMGRTPHIEREYKKNDVFLMTSNYEGLPNALMEAMASGLVCISTDCKTGPRDLIEDGKNGFLVPVGDGEALERKIEYVLDMAAEEREQMGVCARDNILEYCSKEKSLSMLRDILI